MKTEPSISFLKEKIDRYNAEPKPDVEELLGSGPFVLLVGITGAGKDSTKTVLLEAHGHEYHDVVTHTTRSPRFNNGVEEQNGREYHFIDLATSNHMLDNHGYIEANVYSGNVYGMSVAEVEMAHAEGKIAITDLDVNGAVRVERLNSNVTSIFLLPPSYEIWWERFMKRYGEDGMDPQDIKRRMQTAIDELVLARDNNFFNLVINKDLHKCAEDVNQLAHSGDTNGVQRSPEALAIIDEMIQRLQNQL